MATGSDAEDHPLAWLRDEPRLNAIVAALLHERYVCTSSTANLFNCDTHWHNDGIFADEEGRYVLFMIYLDSLTAATGALRVMPGSHHRGPYSKTLRQVLTKPGRPLSSAFGIAPDQLPSHVLDVEPGDVIALDLKVLHASVGGAAGRRCITLNYGTRPGNGGTRTAMERAVSERHA
jgi:ectoine hydroxylase-related dioxygenase (phytanoyl-CoA dioxygenase family)